LCWRRNEESRQVAAVDRRFERIPEISSGALDAKCQVRGVELGWVPVPALDARGADRQVSLAKREPPRGGSLIEEAQDDLVDERPAGGERQARQKLVGRRSPERAHPLARARPGTDGQGRVAQRRREIRPGERKRQVEASRGCRGRVMPGLL